MVEGAVVVSAVVAPAVEPAVVEVADAAARSAEEVPAVAGEIALMGLPPPDVSGGAAAWV